MREKIVFDMINIPLKITLSLLDTALAFLTCSFFQRTIQLISNQKQGESKYLAFVIKSLIIHCFDYIVILIIQTNHVMTYYKTNRGVYIFQEVRNIVIFQTRI